MSAIYLNGTKYGGAASGSLPSGGTAGQILKKNSSTDNDASWANPDVTKNVDDLTNYYTKTQTYTKTEVDTAISNAIGTALNAPY